MTERTLPAREPAEDGRRAVARVVLARRGELGLTQAELAGRAGVAGRTVQYLEAGKTWPQARILAAIARALDLDADELRSIAFESVAAAS